MNNRSLEERVELLEKHIRKLFVYMKKDSNSKIIKDDEPLSILKDYIENLDNSKVNYPSDGE